MRQRDPGVAAGRLDDRPARLELAVALGRLDHRDADPVLDRAAGVQVLELCHDLAAEALAEPAQLDQRGVADHGRRLGGDRTGCGPGCGGRTHHDHRTECISDSRLRIIYAPPALSTAKPPAAELAGEEKQHMFNSRTTTRVRALALALGCASILGLAACGGDDSDDTSTAATSTTSTTTETSADTTTTDADSLDATALREAFNQQLLQVLTTQQDLTQSEAECAIDELESSVSDDELKDAIVEAANTGQPPQDLIDAGFDAGKECAGQ